MDFTPDINTPLTKYGVRSTNVFLPDFFEPVEAIVLVEHDKIADVIIIRDTDPEIVKTITDEWTIENYGNLCVFPGIIDCNINLHTNYDKEWDNVVTSTKLAAAGGVTTIIDNPIMTKTFDTPEEYVEVLKQRIEKLKSSSNADFGLFGVLEPKTEDVIQEMMDLGVLGLKCYLFNCLQSEIGYVYPEFLEGLLKNLSEHYPDLLLIFHPELATERELYLSSPCRLTSLENRLNMNFEIKSLELGGGANKGAYLEELEKSEFSDDLEDDDCPTPSLDTPSKLRSKIKKAKEKTEINQLVHFELMSYGYEENKMDADTYSSDSDLDLLDKSSQSPGLKPSRISSQEKQNEKAGFSLDVNPVSSTKTVKKSLFKKEEIKEEDVESTPKSLLKSGSQYVVKKRSQFSSVRDQDLDIDDQESPLKLSSNSPSKSPYKDSSKLFDDDKSPLAKSPVMKSPVFNERTPREKELTPGNKKNRSSSLVITFHSRVTKLLETHAEEEEDLQSNGHLDTGLTKSPFHMYDKDPEFNDDSNKFSGGIRNILGSGLTKDESSGSEIVDSMRKINLMSDQDKTETSKSTNQYGFSPDSNQTPQEVKTSSLSSSPCFSNDQMLSQNSSLLQRRITRGTSLSIPIRRKGSVSIAPNNSLKIGNTETVKSPIKTESNEQKFNNSYRVFLANRPQSWEENGVSWILSKFKPEMKLRILLQNLSLASSFLKIRQKKKSDQQFTKTLYGDTSTAYLFFNERAVKKGETKYKATPPFRDKENRKWLIENFKLDGIDMVSSYHFFVPPKYKEIDQGNFRRAFSGFESVGLNLQSVWTTIYAFYKKNNKRFNQEPFYQKKLINDALCKICKALCSNPAEFLKIDGQKGKIAKGKDADFVVWDPYKLINNQNLSANHIFSKRILFGVVNKTYIRGKLVYDKENDAAAAVVGANFRAKFVTASSS